MLVHALAQGLLGLGLFPAVAQPRVPQLAEHLAVATAQDEDFRIYFRIVTRGAATRRYLAWWHACERVCYSDTQVIK